MVTSRDLLLAGLSEEEGDREEPGCLLLPLGLAAVHPWLLVNQVLSDVVYLLTHPPLLHCSPFLGLK